jgi:HEAT repeat protein
MYPIKQVHTSSRRFALVILVTVLAVAPSLHASDADIEVLRKGKVRRDDESLVKFLLSCRIDDVDITRRDKLIGQLGSQIYKEWKEAVDALTAMGYAAVPPLRKALKDPNAHVRDKAQHCLDLIGRVPERDTILAACRLMMERQTPKLLETLLQFLPAAPDEDVADEVAYDIDQLAFRDNRIHPAVTAALADKQPARRALAACIVGYRGNAERRAEVAKLLKDVEPIVRLRAAQGLLAAKQKDGLPVLVGLLAEGSRDIAWQAEELLRYVAGKTAPNAFVGFDGERHRQGCHEAWEAWLNEHEAQIDLAAPEYLIRRPGLVLLCDSDPFKGKPTFWLTGCDGTVRWEVRDTIAVLDRSPMLSLARTAWWIDPKRADFGPPGHPETGGRWQPGPTGPWLIANELIQLARRYEYGLLNYGAVSCGGGRVLELDQFNRIKWAAFFSRDTEKAMACGCQERIGLAFSENDEVDLNDTLEYRLRCGQSKNPEIRRQTMEWLGLLALPYLRLLPNGEALLGPSDLRGFESIRFPWDYRRLAPAEAIRATYHADPRIRANAAHYLVTFTHESRLIVPYLIRLLDDPDAKVRSMSLFCLSQMCHERKKTIPLLVRFLRDPDAKTRSAAWHQLGNLAHSLPPMLPGLLSLAEQNREGLLGKYVALTMISPRDERMVSALLLALKNPQLRGGAANLLGYAGEGHQELVVPSLIEALDMPVRDDDGQASGMTKRDVIRALGRLHGDPTAVVPVLVKYAQEKEQPELVRESAIQALGEIGPGAEAALPALKRILAVEATNFDQLLRQVISDIASN